MKTHILFCCVLLIVWTAGCGGEDAGELPTRVALPTVVEATEAVEAVSERADSPTLPPSWTPTLTPTLTATPSLTVTVSVTPSLTITNTPLPTDTPTASPTLRPGGVNSIADLIAQVTPVPTGFVDGIPTPSGQVTSVILPTVSPAPGSVLMTPSPTGAVVICEFQPPGGFGQILINQPTLTAQIGCPVGAPPIITTATSASQPFERGMMVWVDGAPGTIYVFYNDGTFQRFDDTYDPNTDPVSNGETPPAAGLVEPVRGFGKVWRNFGGVRDRLGWATAQETGTTANFLDFGQGRLLNLEPRTETYVIATAPGTWRTVPGEN